LDKSEKCTIKKRDEARARAEGKVKKKEEN